MGEIERQLFNVAPIHLNHIKDFILTFLVDIGKIVEFRHSREHLFMINLLTSRCRDM